MSRYALIAPLLAYIALQSPVANGLPAPQPIFASCARDSFTVVPNNGSGIWPYREYKSSNAAPPNLQIKRNGQPLAPGLIFIDPQNAGPSPGQEVDGTMIITSDDDLVWNGPEGSTSNFRTATLQGEPVLSFWKGSGNAASDGSQGHGYGHVEILNTSYKTIHTVCPKVKILQPPGTNAPCSADVHESYITSNNTILVTMYNTTTADLTSIGGPKHGYVYDPLAVEVDIETNEALWIWSPLAHIPLNTTRYPLAGAGVNTSNPYDWFHMNSIEPYNGNFLINGRHTWSSYYVNRDGDVLWTIDGENGGDFGPLPQDGHFSWQHDARIGRYSDTQSLLTYFANDNSLPNTTNPSIGLGLIIENTPNKACPPKLHAHVVDDNDYEFAFAEGAYQMLENGNAFMGYGVRPVMKEYGPLEETKASVRWTADFGYNNDNNTAQSYRAWKSEWRATPSGPLSLVVERANSDDPLSHCADSSQCRGYVSWNGATDVVRYAVYAGNTKTTMRSVGFVQKKGFETEFVIPGGTKFVQIAAIEKGNSGESGKSNVVVVS